MSRALRTIVVGVGQLDEPDPNLRAAMRIASRGGARLYAVRAFHPPDPLVAAYPEVATFDPDVAHAAELAVLRRLKDRVEELGGTGVECRTGPGPADAVIVDLAQAVSADLIVVGATERGVVSRALLGTTAGRVIRTASAPVLVNRHIDPLEPRRVLLTTDLSDLSGRVHRDAAELALEVGAEGVQLRTLLVVGRDAEALPDAPGDFMAAVTRTDLNPFLKDWTPEAVQSEGRVRVGDATAEILAEVEEWGADLLVLGSHGRGGLSRLLIGSVAEAVSRRAPCDVLVIPAAVYGGTQASGEEDD